MTYCTMCGQPMGSELGTFHAHHVPGKLPESPPRPKTKPSGGFIAAMVICGLIVVGGIITAVEGEEDNGSPTYDAPETTYEAPSTAEYEIPASLVVDSLTSTQIAEFCTAYYALGNYEVAFAAFDATYNQADPSAEEVFDEALARC